MEKLEKEIFSLANKNRRAILNLLLKRKMKFNELKKALDMSEDILSFHLEVLRNNELITRSKRYGYKITRLGKKELEGRMS